MSLPQAYDFSTEVKFYLRSYRAYFDVYFALHTYPAESMTFSRWKVYWAGVCSLLKTSIHLTRVDAKSCFPGPLKEALLASWASLGQNKTEYPIFWKFIDRERHNILKEYEFSAYEAYVAADGEIKNYRTILGSSDLDELLPIRGGAYDGRNAIELAKEAAEWVKMYIENAIRSAGLDPDEKVTSRQFLRRQTGEPDLPSDLPSPPSLGLGSILSGESPDKE